MADDVDGGRRRWRAAEAAGGGGRRWRRPSVAGEFGGSRNRHAGTGGSSQLAGGGRRPPTAAAGWDEAAAAGGRRCRVCPAGSGVPGLSAGHGVPGRCGESVYAAGRAWCPMCQVGDAGPTHEARVVVRSSGCPSTQPSRPRFSLRVEVQSARRASIRGSRFGPASRGSSAGRAFRRLLTAAGKLTAASPRQSMMVAPWCTPPKHFVWCNSRSTTTPPPPVKQSSMVTDSCPCAVPTTTSAPTNDRPLMKAAEIARRTVINSCSSSTRPRPEA